MYLDLWAKDNGDNYFGYEKGGDYRGDRIIDSFPTKKEAEKYCVGREQFYAYESIDLALKALRAAAQNTGLKSLQGLELDVEKTIENYKNGLKFKNRKTKLR